LLKLGRSVANKVSFLCLENGFGLTKLSEKLIFQLNIAEQMTYCWTLFWKTYTFFYTGMVFIILKSSNNLDMWFAFADHSLYVLTVWEVGVTIDKMTDTGRINLSGWDGNTNEADSPCGWRHLILNLSFSSYSSDTYPSHQWPSYAMVIYPLTVSNGMVWLWLQLSATATAMPSWALEYIFLSNQSCVGNRKTSMILMSSNHCSGAVKPKF
jgi:hypothetical protein